jgi:hypothetical protein
MHACIYVCTFMQLYAHMRADVCTHTCRYVHTCMRICACATICIVFEHAKKCRENANKNQKKWKIRAWHGTMHRFSSYYRVLRCIYICMHVFLCVRVCKNMLHVHDCIHIFSPTCGHSWCLYMLHACKYVHTFTRIHIQYAYLFQLTYIHIWTHVYVNT